MIYTAFEIPKHGTRYMRDRKLISKEDIPPRIFTYIKVGENFDDAKSCVFCGAQSNLFRSINTQMVAVCTEHYQNKNLGQTAQKLRENEDESNAEDIRREEH